MAIRYIITTHRHLDGVGLSKPGHWGGARYPDDAAAERAARADARGAAIVIDRETVKRSLHAVQA